MQIHLARLAALLLLTWLSSDAAALGETTLEEWASHFEL